MHIDYCTSKQNGKIYHSILLRHTYRISKDKVQHKTLLNLTNFPKEDIEALDFALKHKKDLQGFLSQKLNRKQHKSFGGVYLIKEIIKKLSIDKALGQTIEGKLALFQLIARVINQGSRLSSIRMAGQQAICEVLAIEDETTEDDLYKNLTWLMNKQKSIEKKLFKLQHNAKPEIFLYDVTSSYLEGKQNALADWGYNRDKKNGKMQIVAGLLCDEEGMPMAIRLFKGNTLDFNTLTEQIKQIANEFGCERVTLVGDRGMIKSKQIKEIEEADFFYITAITKPQIETLLHESAINMSLFDSEIKEVYYEGNRYILRRNPLRVDELDKIREQKKRKVEKLCREKNTYLKKHPKAKPETAIKEINAKIVKLKIDKWLNVELATLAERELVLTENQEARIKEAELDGCYVIKSNLPEDVTKEIIHERYKELKYVEEGFRCLKTDFLEMRPWYVRTEGSTRGHALIVMLAYMIIKYLRDVWSTENITVEEGIKSLNNLSLLEVSWDNEIQYFEVPEPNDQMKRLLGLAGVRLPDTIPYGKVNVYSRAKLTRNA